MDKQSLVIKSAIAGLFTAGALVAAQGAFASGMGGQPNHTMAKTVKCYGVNAAYKNDCKSPGHNCAGLDKKARDPDAFVYMPTGLCQKIAGGSLTPGARHTKSAKSARSSHLMKGRDGW